MLAPIKSLLRRAGVDLVRFPSRTHHPLGAFLASYQIATVLDVGANVGQYGQRLRAEGFRGQIASVEPDPTAAQTLRRTAERDGRWSVHEVALGAAPGTATLHVAALSVFNSLLPPSAYGQQSDARMAGVRDVTVEVRTLDSLLARHPVNGPLLVKIDTQGYESAVLDGAAETLARASGVQLELSLRPLYEGQPTMPAMLDRLSRAGFQPYALMSGYADPTSGALAEVDGLFVRH